LFEIRIVIPALKILKESMEKGIKIYKSTALFANDIEFWIRNDVGPAQSMTEMIGGDDITDEYVDKALFSFCYGND
jgi:hypothetical protein